MENIDNYHGTGQNEALADFGGIIEKLRKRNGLTRRQLVRADDPDYSNHICSEKTLERIEKGETPLTVIHLGKFLEVLGISYTEFFSEAEGPEAMSFLNGFGDVWDLMFEERHDEAKKKMKSLMGKANLGKTLVKQAVMLYNCRARAEMDVGDTGCMEELHKALYLTSPRITVKKNEIALAEVSMSRLSLNEYRILNIIASLKERQGDTAGSIEVYEAVKASLEDKALPSEIRNKMLPTVCYNLSDSLTNQGEYYRATKISEAGLLHGKTVGNFRMDGLLYYSLAKAQHFLGKLREAEENFRNSYISHKVQGRKEMADKVKEFAAEKYNVYVESWGLC